MKWQAANSVVEELRCDTRLYLPGLSKRRGFSSSRVEHLLNRLVQAMPQNECYLEVGTLEGRTLEAASIGNDGKRLYGCDPCLKYDKIPDPIGPNVTFVTSTWQALLDSLAFPDALGLVFYDGDHSFDETLAFMGLVKSHLADEAVLVLDDWDRESVRAAGLESAHCDDRWRLLRECPEYTDGLTTAQHHFGYSFGVAIFGYRR